MRLGSNRSILGAIIRPDSVLLERKGGTTGKLTLTNLFPDVGESAQQQLIGDQHQEIYCNWPLNGEDEEPLPRGNGIPAGGSDVKSSGKKRKASKENSSAKKARGQENGSAKELSSKKQNRRHHQSGGGSGGDSRYDHYGGGSSRWGGSR